MEKEVEDENRGRRGQIRDLVRNMQTSDRTLKGFLKRQKQSQKIQCDEGAIFRASHCLMLIMGNPSLEQVCAYREVF